MHGICPDSLMGELFVNELKEEQYSYSKNNMALSSWECSFYDCK